MLADHRLRPTFRPRPSRSHPVVTRLALNRPRPRAATQAIVARITRGKALPEVLLDEIAAKTDGVPLFVEEMTKDGAGIGAATQQPRRYNALALGPLPALANPTKRIARTSLMARLYGL